LDEGVVLSNWRGETELVKQDGRSIAGFLGKFTYKILDPWPELCRRVGLLADFAFYAGVGKQTQEGLGQVRVDFPT
jgi:CRISPR/Cas system endoribonuclease Cas6 (RAMP superfamily)